MTAPAPVVSSQPAGKGSRRPWARAGFLLVLLVSATAQSPQRRVRAVAEGGLPHSIAPPPVSDSPVTVFDDAPAQAVLTPGANSSTWHCVIFPWLQNRPECREPASHPRIRQRTAGIQPRVESNNGPAWVTDPVEGPQGVASEGDASARFNPVPTAAAPLPTELELIQPPEPTVLPTEESTAIKKKHPLQRFWSRMNRTLVGAPTSAKPQK